MKTNQEIAKEVLAGQWGNGQDRRDRLTAAGYVYDDVQSIVNSLVYGDPSTEEDLFEVSPVSEEDSLYLEVTLDLNKYQGIKITFIGGD